MSWISYFIPRVVLKTNSTFNHDIRVIEEYGQFRLIVDGTRQSGTYFNQFWRHAFHVFGVPSDHPVDRILIFGVAGGTVIRFLRTLFPAAGIVGVDIDPTMIAIGKKYFGLGRIENLKLTVADAQKYVMRKVQSHDRYDVIIVDTFLGRTIPDFILDEKFIRRLKKMLVPGGFVAINYLYEKDYIRKSNILLDKLTKIFHSVQDTRFSNNRFFFASP